jgi:hypothetical protein
MQCDFPRYWCRNILLRFTARVLSVRVSRVARGDGIRPKGFGAWPAALWIGLLLIALLCSGTIGFFEFVR